MDSLIPSHIAHIPASAKSFSPSSNSLQLNNGETVKYDYLIVAAGLQISEYLAPILFVRPLSTRLTITSPSLAVSLTLVDWDKVKGLSNALLNPLQSKVSTIYSYDTCDKTWDLIESTKSGKAIFTQPFGVVKCAGGEF